MLTFFLKPVTISPASVVQVPRDPADPEGDRLAREELSEHDRCMLFLLADRIGAEASAELDREGYYRLLINGPETASNHHFHLHIVAARKGVVFQRCIDPIERRL